MEITKEQILLIIQSHQTTITEDGEDLDGCIIHSDVVMSSSFENIADEILLMIKMMKSTV